VKSRNNQETDHKNQFQGSAPASESKTKTLKDSASISNNVAQVAIFIQESNTQNRKIQKESKKAPISLMPMKLKSTKSLKNTEHMKRRRKRERERERFELLGDRALFQLLFYILSSCHHLLPLIEFRSLQGGFLGFRL